MMNMLVSFSVGSASNRTSIRSMIFCLTISHEDLTVASLSCQSGYGSSSVMKRINDIKSACRIPWISLPACKSPRLLLIVPTTLRRRGSAQRLISCEVTMSNTSTPDHAAIEAAREYYSRSKCIDGVFADVQLTIHSPKGR